MSGAVFLVSCLTASFLAFSPTSIVSTDRPVHLTILTLVCLSVALSIIAGRSTSRSHDAEYIPLQDEQKLHPKIKSRVLRKQSLYLILVGAIFALTTRIDLQRRLFLASECATRSKQVWLPFLVAIYDALRWQKPGFARQDEDEEEDDLDSSAYHDLVKSVKLQLLSTHWRFLPTTFILSLGCYMVAGLWLSSESSHICPQSSSDLVGIPRLQILVLFLDTALAIAALELALGAKTASKGLLSLPNVWSTAAIACVTIWSAVCIVLVQTQPEHRAWMFLRNELAPSTTLFVLLYQAVFLTVLVVSSLYSVSISASASASAPLTRMSDHCSRSFAYYHCSYNSFCANTRGSLHMGCPPTISPSLFPKSHMVICVDILRMVHASETATESTSVKEYSIVWPSCSSLHSICHFDLSWAV